ncbi:uncharacterized protein KQ657_002393 [Scheffersomyces spartinae]|uniref:C2H2-type domain-containing protein n=1 Tax=Scheffersomyces spartinae TaxID=45513 RepID=A0A9P7V611_9ASCO|nr:uncharacterized protein KQ657_002393 [Scheffersomyces spartinae]KAG7192038.1 hypothetical protein KQ657_002393 [Scheffersomyces spartinae]
MSGRITCTSCGLEFPSSADQRTHMKGDWHRYNLKRRVAQLPPISEDLFKSKVATLSSSNNEAEEDSEANGSGREKQVTKKELRRREKEALLEKKRQLLELAKAQMIAKINGDTPELKEELKEKLKEEEVKQKPEQKDLQPESPEQNLPLPSDSELTEDQLAEKLMAIKLKSLVEIPSTTCLFCHPKQKASFSTVEENVEHMFAKHGLFVPEQLYLVDLEGLIKYLGEKIGLGNVCLVCSYQGRNVEAVREHMNVKRHMRIPYESENEKLEISEFYDFSSTYEQDGDAAEGDDEDWEDVSGEEDDDDEDDDDYSMASRDRGALLQHGHDLILPSGAVLGHRQFARYYRQNLAPERELTEGQGTVIAAETRHMLTVKDRQELAVKKRAWSRQKKREDVNDRRAAKFVNNQPHFRDQLLQ